MIWKRFRSLLILLKHTAALALLFFLSLNLTAQSKKEIEKKKQKLHQEIEFNRGLLEETRKNKRSSLNQLVTLNKQISIREELISTIGTEVRIMDRQIAEAASIISAMEEDIKKLKEEYAKMIYYAYKNNNSYNRLMFIFASDDFNQAYKRLKYLQQYSEYRRAQRDLIERTQQALNSKKSELEEKKISKTKLLKNQEGQKQELDHEKTEQVAVLNQLQEKEKKLREEIAKKQRDESRLTALLEDIIRKEIENAREKAKKEGKKTEAGVLAMTPEAQKLSNDFAGNRGKLPWPVEQGNVTGTFGRHPHPVLTNIIVNNNGIDINSNKGAIARSVFEGEVRAVVVIPGAQKAVVVQHGEYYTLYSNLEEVFVKMGDKVITKQSIGRIYTEEEDAKTEVHLEIWKGNVKMNPAEWIMKR